MAEKSPALRAMMTLFGCALPRDASVRAPAKPKLAALRRATLTGLSREDQPWAFWLDLAVKLSLVLLLAFGAFSGLERFPGKAFGWRLAGYSVAALLVPAIWAARGRRLPYPYVVDILFVTRS